VAEPMSYYANPGVSCFNVLASAWLCAYCCAPLFAPVVAMPTRTMRLSDATVTAGAYQTGTALPGLPLLVVPCFMER